MQIFKVNVRMNILRFHKFRLSSDVESIMLIQALGKVQTCFGFDPHLLTAEYKAGLQRKEMEKINLVQIIILLYYFILFLYKKIYFVIFPHKKDVYAIIASTFGVFFKKDCLLRYCSFYLRVKYIHIVKYILKQYI